MSERILQLSDAAESFSANGSVVYVMHRDQRLHDNHALLAAQSDAIHKKVPLIIVFLLYGNLGNRAREQYRFMLDGLRELKQSATSKNTSFIMRYAGDGDTDAVMMALKEFEAASVYFDFSPLCHARKLAKSVAKKFDGASYVVDTHNIVPVWVASDKQEYAAHTIRRKLHKLLESYLKEPDELQQHPYELTLPKQSLSFEDAETIIAKASSNGTKTQVASGETNALQQLKKFITHDLGNYAHGRNDIAVDQQTGFSPYLHFGQLSSLRVALEMIKVVDEPPLLLRQPKMAQAGEYPSKADGMNALLEEMIVRKELADNFCFYNDHYDELVGAPDWALKSLNEHLSDTREHLYTEQQLEDAETHDELWNAAQQQLRSVGNIHGYMRMYWAKKVLEWSETPTDAIRLLIKLNDHYSIDGGDPNGYVGILWSVAGLHDRPWFERAIYGKIRYMTDTGIARKYDVERYKSQWL